MVSPNDSNTTSEELESIPDLVSSASLSDSGQQISSESEPASESLPTSQSNENSSKERVTENSSSRLFNSQNSSKDSLLEDLTFHRNFKRTGVGKNTPRKQVTFTDQKMPIDKSLSHKKNYGGWSKKLKYPHPGLRRSPRNSRQNLVQMASFDWPELVAFLYKFWFNRFLFNAHPYRLFFRHFPTSA